MEVTALDGLCVTVALIGPRLPRWLAVQQAHGFLRAPPASHVALLLAGAGVAGRTAPEEALNVAQAGREARGRGQRGLGQRPSPHLNTRRARTHDTDLLGLPNAPAISRLLSSGHAESEPGRSPRGADFPPGMCIFFLKSKQTWKSLGQAQLILVSNENSRWPRGSDLPGRARALQPCRLQARAGRVWGGPSGKGLKEPAAPV